MKPRNSSRWMYRGAKQLVWSLGFASLFIFAQSYALSLQNLQVNSALGEPLDAIIQVNAAPGEVLSASCISTSAVANGGMPGIPGVRLSLSRQLAPGTLRLTTARPVREPLSELVVNIRCAGAPNIERRFLIMLDPRGVTEQVIAQNTQTAYLESTYSAPTVQVNNTSAAYAAAAAPVIGSDSSAVRITATNPAAIYPTRTIVRGERYIVRNGESLSTIASRIEGRASGTVWSWAATLQSANPQAFINGNPNELVAGSALIIPMNLSAGTQALKAARDVTGTRAPRDSWTNSADVSSSQASGPQPTEQAMTPAPLAVSVDRTTIPTAVGGVFATQPTMVLSRSFSGVSRERLDQRKAGVVHQAPANLPMFGDAANDPQPQAPAVEPSPIPAAPAQEQPRAVVADTSNPNRLSWLSALGGLALLGLAFFAGLFFARRRAQQALEEQVDARLSEERYFERVRTNRRNVTESVLNSSAAGGIEVSESVRTEDLSDDTSTDDDYEAVEEIELSSAEIESDPNLAEPLLDNEVSSAENSELDLNVGGMDTLTEIDLELLERDYAAQTYDDLEKIATAGAGNATELVRPALDLEFPEDVKMRRESDHNYDTMEFDTGNEDSLDFDIGNEVSRTDETLEGLSIDLAEAGANIDAQIEAIQSTENSIDDSDRAERSLAEKAAEQDNTSSMPSLEQGQNDTGEMPILNQDSDTDFTATSTRDSEEFYHLEASSIMHVGEMDFEKELDDETNILRFRKRGNKTGTDDSGDT